MKATTRRRLLFLIALLCFTIGPGWAVFAQSSGTGPAVTSASILPPEHPITQSQLEALLVAKETIETQKDALRAQLEMYHASQPAWFPASVWNEAKSKVEEINVVELLLPIYQRYMSQEQADAQLLLFQGPDGQAIADAMKEAVLEAFDQGKRGAQIDKSLLADRNKRITDLVVRRIRSLNPEQQAIAVPHIQEANLYAMRLDNETNDAYRKKANDIIQAVFAAHKVEIQAAQRRASQTPSKLAPTTH